METDDGAASTADKRDGPAEAEELRPAGEAPDQAEKPLLNSDAGGHHLAFHVDGMDAAIAFLKDRGVKVLGEPMPYTAGPNLGLTWCCFMAPRDAQL